MTRDEAAIERLRLCGPGRGRSEVLAEVFDLHRKRLRSMVLLRLHPRLRSRVDPSDVLQEAFLHAAKKLEGYLASPRIPLFLWLRRMAGDALYNVHRRHFGAVGRDVRRERAFRAQIPDATSEMMAERFASDRTSPLSAAQREERRQAILNALERLQPADREILALRVFEQLTGEETASLLGIQRETAKKRYLRALQRFKDLYGGPLPE